MIEEPNFDYQYNLAFRKSFAARLTFSILLIATGVFLVAALIYLYVTEDSVKQETAQKAKMALHDAVATMRVKAMEAQLQQRQMTTAEYVAILETVKPYEHSFTVMMDQEGKWVHIGNASILKDSAAEQKKMKAAMMSGKSSMEVVENDSKKSLLIYEPVEGSPYVAGVICSRIDILMGYRSLLFYAVFFFILGLVVLSSFCAFAIIRMVKPLNHFAESARSIAGGNLDTALPEIRSKDELGLLRDSFEYMQSSLKEHIKELQQTTAKKEHMESELTIAHNIQMSMISADFPVRKDVDLFASLTPAREVGGDLYDFIIDGDELFFVIGDVAGKGVPASLFMATTRSLFRHLAGNYQSAANIVREINHTIASSNGAFVFVTMFVGVLDLRNHLLTYCNAGHNPPVLLPDEGPCRLLEVMPQVPVGIIDHYQYEEQQMDFPPGTALLLYTDGLTEAENTSQAMFGEQRLMAAVEENRQMGATDIIRFLTDCVGEYAGGMEQSDDLTMLFFRHLAEDRPRPATRHIVMKNELREIERLHGFVSSVCQEFDADPSFRNDVDLALEEVVVNVINYAYPRQRRGHIEVTTWGDDGCLCLSVKDSGVPFDPTSAGEVNVDVPLEERAIGGLGIHLVRQLMDELSYERTADGYNVLTMKKRIADTDN
ncbi:MAG: SpoIIE family protein phosphatase [Prevotella sp.]|nr:SpoIIE family protein phosphatase [Prevotella sp.]